MSRGDAALAAAGVAGFLLSCLLVGHGVRDPALYSDVHVYARYAGEMAAGKVPYRDFFDEYPPLAQPVFLAGRVAGAANFALAFKALMALCGAGALVCGLVTLRAIGASFVQRVVAVAVVAVAPLLTGPIFLNAYDLWPAFLLALALALLVTGRPRLALGVLGAAVAAKVYPLAVLPVALLYLDRRLRRGAAFSFAAVLALAHLPFAVLGPGGLRYSYSVQLRRGLEFNSLGASVLLAAQKLGLYHASIGHRPPGSDNLIGGLPDTVAALSGVALVLVVAAVTIAFARGRRNGRALVLAAAAGVAAFVALDKVFSAQYVDWLVPVAPLAGLAAAGVTVAILALTRLVFSHRVGVEDGTGAVWLLLGRDLVVLALAATLALGVRHRGAVSDTQA